ncbi:riboflavin synthase [Candidatus Woesearchaeota archaeon]|nr:riboflavin synthase [Candidatus Woesearchaeota archaeon]
MLHQQRQQQVQKVAQQFPSKVLVIGIADTTFARVDLYPIVAEVIQKNNEITGAVKIERYTVPGIKDLPVACLRLLEDYNCAIAMAIGMPGAKPIDKQCAHEASIGFSQVQLQTKKHILEVFIHLDEVNLASSTYATEMAKLARNRAAKHAEHLLFLLQGKESLSPFAGTGKRQGFADAGSFEQEIQKSKQVQQPLTLGIVAAHFNLPLTLAMVEEAKKEATHAGCRMVLYEVPGVFEIPFVVQKLLDQGEVDGIVTLGAVIQGETGHDELIAQVTAAQLTMLSLHYRKPVTLGFSGPRMTVEQAKKRSKPYAQRAVRSCLEMIKVSY